MTASSRSRRTVHAGEQGATGFLLTPSAQATLLCLNAFQTNLRIWRSVADSMRDSVRSQQDTMLKMLLDRAEESPAEERAAEAATDPVAAANGASTFFMPVLAARRAYVQMSGAMIEAQREALAAMVQAPRPH